MLSVPVDARVLPSMSWFGFGGKKPEGEANGGFPEKTDMAMGADDYTSGHGDNFGSAPGAGGQVSRPSGGAAPSQEMLQRAVLQEQRGDRVPL